jgi:hypothetical protein
MPSSPLMMVVMKFVETFNRNVRMQNSNSAAPCAGTFSTGVGILDFSPDDSSYI